MNSTTFDNDEAQEPAPGRNVLGLLERLRHGSLSLQLPDGTSRHFGRGEPHAAMSVRRWDVFRMALARGDVGLAEAYVEGHWHTPDLAGLLGLFVANRNALHAAIYGNGIGRLLDRLRHLLNRNTRTGSRRNIHVHYDLGNEFYGLWLDETMTYSAALFGGAPGQPLAQAQHAKLRRTLREARVAPGARLLEIGCGWGSLAHMAASEFRAEVTGVTLSTEQLDFARRRLAAPECGGRAQVRLQDYREIADGSFDAICSIEMVEAVGREFWPDYFGAVARLLKPGGRACIQTIVIDDALWARYVRGTDFIQQYVFPGGCLPCPREFVKQAERAGLRVENQLSFGGDYALTLRLWRERFLAERAKVLELGFDTAFLRLWEFYLCYCEAAFTHANTDVLQYTLYKP